VPPPGGGAIVPVRARGIWFDALQLFIGHHVFRQE
jgi:hypothetical protein